MNYLRQIAEFNGRLQVVPLSARAQALWYCLMWHANSAWWRSPLSLAESTLRGELGLNHDQFLRARAELVQSGYVETRPQAGRKACHYYIIDLEQQRKADEERREIYGAAGVGLMEELERRSMV